MDDKKILIAGIGNIFLGDDAFGVEVARQLSRSHWPDNICVRDFGIRAYDLAFALMEKNQIAILVDALPRGEIPGTLFLLDLSEANASNRGEFDSEENIINGHSMNAERALELVNSLGGKTGKIYLVGCEPAVLESENGEFGLSEKVRAAVPQAIAMIESLINDLLATTKTFQEENYA